MSAAELRQAAETLRGAGWTERYVAEITNGTDTTVAYRSPHGGYYLDRQGPDLGTPRPGTWVTRTFHEHIRPDLALALAEWLDFEALMVAKTTPPGREPDVADYMYALNLASLINGAAA